MRELDNMAIEAKTDQTKFNRLILEHEFFILKSASGITNRYITKSDDEWSIALLAFSQAVQNYRLDKGAFMSFAKLVIHRRLIDYCRNQAKHSFEISVNPIVFDTQIDEVDEDIAVQAAVAERVSQKQSDSLKLEIESANEAFSQYGFSFFDLADCSPKAEKTKSACAKAVVYLLRNPILICELRSSKQLPLKIIEKNTKVPRKILERHRKYIIAAVEIFQGEYLCLTDYMRCITEELGK